MAKILEIIKEKATSDIVSAEELALWTSGTLDSRYGKVRRALAVGDLEQISRGLYIIGSRSRRAPVNLFEVSQRLYGPSYISCESALSYWQLIPDRVSQVVAMTSKRSNDFLSPIGMFSYIHLNAKPLFFGTQMLEKLRIL